MGLLAAAVLCLSVSAFSAEIVDRIVAVVNDDIIRLKELNQAVAPMEKQIREKNDPLLREQEEIYKIRTEVLNNLIDEALADQEIREAGIFVEEREIDSAIEQVKAANYYSDEDLRQALTASGITMDAYREEIRHQMQRNKLVSQKIESKIIVTDSDIEAYYSAHPEKYASRKKYFLQNILITDPLEDPKIQTVYEQLEKGMPFEEAAGMYSQAPNAAEGGRLGFFALEDLTETIRTAVGDLSPGEFSAVTETEQGLQIFYVREIKETPGRSLEDAEDEIRRLLYEENVNRKFQAWIETLRQEAHIKIIR